MGVDTSIYSILKPLDIQTDGASKGLDSIINMRQLATQQKSQALRDQQLQKQMGREDIENQRKDEEHRISQLGSSIEKLSGMTPEQRATAIPLEMESQVKRGVITPEEAAKYQNMDEGMFGQIAHSYFNSPTYQSKQKLDMEKKLHEAQIKHYGAEDAKLYAEQGKLANETKQRITGAAGQVTDPALLVPTQVPKEHQEAVFKEIDAAQNTKRMSQEIMENFEKTAKENSNLKNGYGVITTHGASGALHQALQPTFKDLEGTVRQAAMDNTFKNVTPAPGDTEETIQTKRQALAQYLQSKASAPRSLAYGIDLKKFENTTPYEVKKKEERKDGGIDVGTQNANAGQGPSTPKTPDGTILMKFPDGALKVVPKDQKGKWIAAGGDVVG